MLKLAVSACGVHTARYALSQFPHCTAKQALLRNWLAHREGQMQSACCYGPFQHTSKSRILCSMSPYSASSWRVLSLW